MSDLAQATGLSKMTISRVLSGSDGVRENTRAKVFEAVESLGYEYNALAGNFASGRTGLIGVAVDVRNLMGSTYFSRLFEGLYTVLEEAGFRVVIIDTASKEFPDGPSLGRLVSQKRVDGLIAIVPPNNRSSFLSSFKRQQTAVVLVGARLPETIVPWVDLDNRHAIGMLLNHLQQLGHRKIGFLAGPSDISDAAERSEAFHSLRSELKMPWKAEWEQSGEFNLGKGREGAARMLQLEDAPTAILAANDASALGAHEAVRRLGLTPGLEVSVAGVDGSELSEQADPPITTVIQPLMDMGKKAAQLLLNELEGNPSFKDSHIFQGRLITRASTAPLPQN
jgi:DNA-binding LacI/PurR family transcriptional regulator